jgi:hypothetical protein
MSKQAKDQVHVPTNVVVICSIMVAGSAVAVVLGVIQLLVRAGILQGGAMDSSVAPFGPTDAMQSFLFLMTASLGLGLGWKNYQGRLWARNLTIVLGMLIVIAAAAAFLMLSTRLTVLASISYGVAAILSIIVLAVIWRQESNGFYHAHRGSKPTRDEELPTHSGVDFLGSFPNDGQSSNSAGVSAEVAKRGN